MHTDKISGMLGVDDEEKRMKWAPVAVALAVCVIAALLIWQPFEKIAQNDADPSDFHPHMDVVQGPSEQADSVVPFNHGAEQRSDVGHDGATPDVKPAQDVILVEKSSVKATSLVSRAGANQDKVFELVDGFAASQNLDDRAADQLRTILLTEDAALASTRDPKLRSAALRETDKMVRSLLTKRQFDSFRKVREFERTKSKQGFR